MCMMMYWMGLSGHDAHARPAETEAGVSLLEILKRRYALGEITREQFQQLKHTLGVSDPRSASEDAPR